MKILMLNYEFPPIGGGAANACFYLLKEFAKNPDLSIDLVTCSANNKFEVEDFSKNIRVYKLDVKKKDMHYWRMKEIAEWTFKAYRLSKKLMKDNGYDLCHCWFGWPSGIIGYWFRKKVPYIVALRGSDVPGYNPRLKMLDKVLFSPISRKVWKNAGSVIANSEGLKELALKTLDGPIKVIYNGIDIEEFKPSAKKSSAKKGNRIKLISTGRLIERKGYDYLIDAIKSDKERFELELIGDGNLKESLKERAKGLPVSFLGKKEHSEIKRHLQNADVFVLPSLNEGMSNSILEAMACSLPIITTDVGGSKELIKGNGFVVERASVEGLRDALSEYSKDPSLMEKHGSESRKIAESMSWKSMATEYRKEYKRCAE